MSAARQSYATLTVEHRDGVDWLTLNRPAQFNALNRAMMDELLDYFGGLYFNHAVRVVVLRGAGKHFCAGLDLNEAGDFTTSVAAGARGQRRVAEIILRMRRCPQPIVALVQGAATDRKSTRLNSSRRRRGVRRSGLRRIAGQRS